MQLIGYDRRWYYSFLGQELRFNIEHKYILFVLFIRKPSIISYSSFLVQDFVRIFVYVKIDVVRKSI
ncbi:hypothetical protein K1719_020526 [Acacia pycnantha]|nr:hypothetical protein K1719_020526 [Acacia pycnantha]